MFLLAEMPNHNQVAEQEYTYPVCLRSRWW